MSKSHVKKRETSPVTVASSERQSSSVANSLETIEEVQKNKFLIWHEWCDAEVSKEKWVSTKESDSCKSKPRSPNAAIFKDPEGEISLLSALKVHSWKHPSDILGEGDFFLVEDQMNFDLVSPNSHLFQSELMRWIINDIHLLWMLSANSPSQQDRWKPWEHVYSRDHLPQNNGKYLVKLYWMGCWRKVFVSDLMPYDEENRLLLPASTRQSELWPMLLSKALLKVASTTFVQNASKEMSEFAFVHTLTGWIPEISSVNSARSKIWEIVSDTLPKFKHRDESVSVMKPDTADPAAGTDSSLHDTESLLLDTNKSKDLPEAVVFARSCPFQLQNNIFSLRQMENSCEILRIYGLSSLYDHVVLLTRTRSSHLETPPTSPPGPRWKAIRSPKKVVLFSEPQRIPSPKLEQFVEIASPFLSYCCHSTVGSTPKKEAKQTMASVHSHGSPLVAITETEETESLEHDGAKSPTTSANLPKIEVTAEDKIKDDESISNERQNTVSPMQKIWMDLDDFAKCFENLLIFHKPQSYANHLEKSNYWTCVQPKTMEGSTESVSRLTGSHAVANPECPEVRGSYYLCVDSLRPSQILISLSALLLWGDSCEENKSSFGVLIITPHCWTNLQTMLPVLSIKTTYSKAAMLNVPPGRSVFCIHARAAVGYNIHLCSQTPFIFGDEETVISLLKKESACFTEQASSIFRALCNVVAFFSNEQELPALRKTLDETLCPQNITSCIKRWEQRKVFYCALYHMVCEALGRKLTAEERLAVRALTAQPSLGASDSQLLSVSLESKPPEVKRSRQPTKQEVSAAIILQAALKGYLVRQTLKASTPGTKENLAASQILSDIWSKMEPDADKHAALLLRYILNNSGKNSHFETCLKAESTRLTFSDYSVSLQETTSSWLLVFREVFHIPEEMMLIPKLYSTISNCLLHVVNNDTGEEVSDLEVVPQVYQPNKRGYTFLVEVIAPKIPSGGAQIKLRFIGLKDPLPQLSREAPNNAFFVKEFQEYYIPDNKNLICRHRVQVTSDVLGTILFETSNPDVWIRLSILEQEKELAGNTGKGFVMLPVFFFLANKEENSQVKSSHQDTSQHGGVAESHTYVVQAEVLFKSWNLDDAQLAFVEMLHDIQKKEVRGSGVRGQGSCCLSLLPFAKGPEFLSE